MQKLSPLVLEHREVHEPSDRRAAAGGVGESERVGGVFELAHLPADGPILGAVHHLDAGEKAVVEGALEGVLGERPLHEVEPSAAREMLVAVGVFLVAHADGAQQRQFANLQPEVGDGGRWSGVALRRVDLVVDVELVDEIVFRGPVVELVHPPLDAEPGPTQGNRVGEPGVEAALIRRLVAGAGPGAEGHRVDLRAAADLHLEVSLLRLGLIAAGPLRSERGVAADLVGRGLLRVLRSRGNRVRGGGLRRRRGGRSLAGHRERLGLRCRLELLKPPFEQRDPLPVSLDRLRDVGQGGEPCRHARDRQRWRSGRIG